MHTSRARATSESSDQEENFRDLEADEEEERMRTLSFGALAAAQDDIQVTKASFASSEHGNAGKQKIRCLRKDLGDDRDKAHGSSANLVKEHQRITEERPRLSKHAPAEQSSKRQVSRRRVVTDASSLHSQQVRSHFQGDPRFNAAVGTLDREQVRKNYTFLTEYQQQELQDLKASLNKGQKRRHGKLTAEQESKLKKEIVRRENKMKAEAQKKRERLIASQHRRVERQKVKEGKTPFFVKNGRIKEQARNEAWEAMKKKDQDKAEQKRWRRREAKVMKKRPEARRVG